MSDTTSTPNTDRAEDVLLEHEYDGIREYDNPSPGWWRWLFVASTVWAVGYFAHYHIGWGQSVAQSYAAAMEKAAADNAQRAMAADVVTEDALAQLLSSANDVAQGRDIFLGKCSNCHGQQGEGLIGPNLTDDYFLHGSTLMDTYKVIDEGVPAKGMVAWGGVLKPEELLRVTAFVGSLRGTNVAGKAPQGERAAPPEAAEGQ